MKNHYTTQEVAEITGVTHATVNNWIKSGLLKSFKTPGGHNRIGAKHLKIFLHENEIPERGISSTPGVPRILVVEDDEDVMEFITAVLKDFEFDIKMDIAEDGFSAGSKIHSFGPDLVILDIMLPGISGFDVCSQIRKELGDEIKVLAMTGYYKEENRQKILQAGADDFIRKPLVLKEFKEKIKNLLERT